MSVPVRAVALAEHALVLFGGEFRVVIIVRSGKLSFASQIKHSYLKSELRAHLDGRFIRGQLRRRLVRGRWRARVSAITPPLPNDIICNVREFRPQQKIRK